MIICGYLVVNDTCILIGGVHITSALAPGASTGALFSGAARGGGHRGHVPSPLGLRSPGKRKRKRKEEKKNELKN